ncbi:unnamed protein product [Oikopleura dioica]|uniref:Uncharacterized protein n=1 Tax=Oikopleura dioica TaxID=34765 RepID=E4Y2H8_OIKDI|nr:unnamed protein product [Oikopleura dioica]
MRKTTAKSPKNIITFINCNKQFFLDRRRPARTGADRRRPAQTGADRRKPAQTGYFQCLPELIPSFTGYFLELLLVCSKLKSAPIFVRPKISF